MKTVATYPAITEPFHGERSEAWIQKAGEPVTSTTTFVAELAAISHHQVVDFPELDFDFVDREIFPLSAGPGADVRDGAKQRGQLRRLAEHYDFIVPDGQPAITVYLIAHAAPERGAYRRRSFEATKVIVEKLRGDRRVANVSTGPMRFWRWQW